MIYLLTYKNESKENIYKRYTINSEYTILTLGDSRYSKYTSEVIKDWLNNFITNIPTTEKNLLIVAIPEIFKKLSGKTKLDSVLGYILPCKYSSNFSVVYIPTTYFLFCNPDINATKINQAVTAINSWIDGTYTEPSIKLEYAKYFKECNKEVKQALDDIIANHDKVTIDIETTGLKHYDSELVSIGIATDLSKGISFKVTDKEYLRYFFENYNGTCIYHNITFDVYFLIYSLYMKSLHDIEGLYKGLDILLKNYDDTKLIAYLATNSCSGNSLSLKSLAQEFAGDWALSEITDLSKVSDDTLLEYNLNDCLSTWFIYNKYYPKMEQDNQKDIYENVFKPAVKDIIVMQLIGMPISLPRVLEVERELQSIYDSSMTNLANSKLIIDWEKKTASEWVINKNKTLKTKQVTVDDCPLKFKCTSSKDIKSLLYDYLKLPILNYTTKNLPATDKDTLRALLNVTKDKDILDIIQSLLDFTEVAILLRTFIKTFKEKSVYDEDLNHHFIYGNFVLGGTVSGRLSSNEPNLQNLPSSGNKYSKLVKSCFKPPKGYIMCGLDFDALEDHISALTTKDTNKLKVYTDGYDGHCLRAYAYFKDKMPDIVMAEPEERCYKAIVNGKEVYFTGSEKIIYLDKEYTGDSLYECLQTR